MLRAYGLPCRTAQRPEGWRTTGKPAGAAAQQERLEEIRSLLAGGLRSDHRKTVAPRLDFRMEFVPERAGHRPAPDGRHVAVLA